MACQMEATAKLRCLRSLFNRCCASRCKRPSKFLRDIRGGERVLRRSHHAIKTTSPDSLLISNDDQRRILLASAGSGHHSCASLRRLTSLLLDTGGRPEGRQSVAVATPQGGVTIGIAASTRSTASAARSNTGSGIGRHRISKSAKDSLLPLQTLHIVRDGNNSLPDTERLPFACNMSANDAYSNAPVTASRHASRRPFAADILLDRHAAPR